MTDETLVHVGPPARGDHWAELLPSIVPGLSVRQWPDIGDPARVRYAAMWTVPDGLFDRLPALDLLFSVGAGVDQLDPATVPPRVTLIRTIEPGLVEEMVDYATLAVLALHRDLPHYLREQGAARWTPRPIVARHERRVGIMGLGTMGGAIAARLSAIGFPVLGWSRGSKALPGIELHAGADALPEFLGRSDILLCVLPLTPETRHILNATTLALLPPGAAVVNIGRGPQVDSDALVAALDSGHLRAAMLDVTDPEPLPADHALWHHPGIWLTPHVAGDTDVDGGARSIATAILRHRAGEAIPGRIDRGTGY